MNTFEQYEENCWASLFYEIGVARLIEEGRYKNVVVSTSSRDRIAGIKLALQRIGAWR